MNEDKPRYFQVLNESTGRYVKYDRDQGRIINCKKSPGPYKGVEMYKDMTETEWQELIASISQKQD
jgi:hypothetical protein